MPGALNSSASREEFGKIPDGGQELEASELQEASGNTLNAQSLYHSKHNLINLPRQIENSPLGEKQRQRKSISSWLLSIKCGQKSANQQARQK